MHARRVEYAFPQLCLLEGQANLSSTISDDLAVALRKAGTREYAFATGNNCDAARDCVTAYFGMLYGIQSLEKMWSGRGMKVL